MSPRFALPNVIDRFWRNMVFVGQHCDLFVLSFQNVYHITLSKFGSVVARTLQALARPRFFNTREWSKGTAASSSHNDRNPRRRYAVARRQGFLYRTTRVTVAYCGHLIIGQFPRFIPRSSSSRDRPGEPFTDFPDQDLPNRLIRHTVLAGQIHDCWPRCSSIIPTNSHHVARREDALTSTSSVHHRIGIVLLRSFAQMIWTTARRIIASMQDPILRRQVPERKLIRNSTGNFPAPCDTAFAFYSNQCTSIGADPLFADPRPAAVFAAPVNLRPEPFWINTSVSDVADKRPFHASYDRCIVP